MVASRCCRMQGAGPGLPAVRAASLAMLRIRLYVSEPGRFGSAGAPNDQWHNFWRLLRKAWLHKAFGGTNNPAYGRTCQEAEFDFGAGKDSVRSWSPYMRISALSNCPATAAGTSLCPLSNAWATLVPRVGRCEVRRRGGRLGRAPRTCATLHGSAGELR